MLSCVDHRRSSRLLWIALAAGAALFSMPVRRDLQAAPVDEKGTLILDHVPGVRFQLEGFVGRRVQANVDRWLTVAPKNNPGLLEMFARRDSGPQPNLVPWAGEFVGKYLISGVQAMRMSEDPKLKETLQGVVSRLLDLQAEDGYLGPWPKRERLRGHWDLWGHYHVMLGLMLWHEHTGDSRAAAAAGRIADVVCDTCLDTDFRVADAGSPEMNMGIIHGMARIYRRTGRRRYLRMAREVLKDFRRAGDYYRTGLAGKEFHRTPKPRWESLHSLQGMVELYRVTGDESFRRAFLHHRASIRRFDRRNTGGFSSGEQATGNPYLNNAIETCCVVAWQAVMIDALRLTGDSTIADDLELTTLNAMLGAQHPSGAWCTYDTPMDGRRIPSHVKIRFQARSDTPHLNCCSVNGPRGYGTISEWGLMRSKKALVLNYYGPMQATVPLPDGTPVTIRQQTDYPVGDTVRLTIQPARAKQFTLALRIPGWSTQTEVSVGGEPVAGVEPGRYLELTRRWQPGEQIMLKLGMRVRHEPGDLQQYGKVSLYRGPILLALDDRFHSGQPPTIDPAKLSAAEPIAVEGEIARAAGRYKPWLMVRVPTQTDGTVPLIDFASAGATTVEGKPLSSYVSWLPAVAVRPPAPVAWRPGDRAKVGPGAIQFAWRRPARQAAGSRMHRVLISDSPTFERIVLRYGEKPGTWLLLPKEEAAKLTPHEPYFWKLIARNEHGSSESIRPYKQFTVDPTVPPLAENWPYGQREQDMVVTHAPLRGDVGTSYGKLLEGKGWKPAAGPGGSANGAVQTDGKAGIVKYKLLAFPEEDYSVSIWVSVTRLPEKTLGQVFSAWSASMDDPLRLVVDRGRLFARIEAGGAYGTEGVEIRPGRWYHLAAVKRGGKLTLYVDGQARTSAQVPEAIYSGADTFAIGGNPKYGGPEFLAAKLANLRLYARALSGQEIQQLFKAGGRGQ